jgi:hypothetical protein
MSSSNKYTAANPEKVTGGRTLLYESAEDGDLATVISEIEKGANVNFVTRRGTTPLIIAAYHGHEDILNALLGAGANVNHIVSGNTALTKAAEEGNESIVKILLAAGANVNIPETSDSPFLKAEEGIYTPSITRLILEGNVQNINTALAGATSSRERGQENQRRRREDEQAYRRELALNTTPRAIGQNELLRREQNELLRREQNRKNKVQSLVGNTYRKVFANAGLRSEGKTGSPATHLIEEIMKFTPYKNKGQRQGAAAGGHGGGRRKTKKVKKYNRRKSRSN